jgi:hypothetical protein
LPGKKIEEPGKINVQTLQLIMTLIPDVVEAPEDLRGVQRGRVHHQPDDG